MKFLFDFFPVLLFFIAYKLEGIFVATAVAIVASVLQVGLYWLRHRRFETSHLVTLVLIAVFGGLTLFLHDETFIKWKPTIINWLFSAVFIGSQYIGKKTIIERMMGTSLTLPDFVWLRLNTAWAIFFIGLGFANWYVMASFDTDTWVNFKMFGMTGLTLVFLVAQGFYLTKYLQNELPEKTAQTEED